MVYQGSIGWGSRDFANSYTKTAAEKLCAALMKAGFAGLSVEEK